MSLGRNVRKLRNARKWTLADLAERSGVGVGTIHALEQRDSKRSQYAVDLADAFGLSVAELEGRAVASVHRPKAAEATPSYAGHMMGLRDLLARVHRYFKAAPPDVRAFAADAVRAYLAQDNASVLRPLELMLKEYVPDDEVAMFLKPAQALDKSEKDETP